MSAPSPPLRHVVAVLVAMTAALIFRAWLQVELQDNGLPRQRAADIAYLVVPPTLLLLLFPVLSIDRDFLAARFSRVALTTELVLRAVGVGLALRALWWAQTTAGISFGIYQREDPLAVRGPSFAFDCPPAQFLLLGVSVMCLLVPVIEEVAHRAYVQGALARFGALIAVPVSALVFAAFHAPSSWGFTFFAGIVFGAQFWNSRSLWPSLITHATVNGLIQLDWHCLKTQWNPHPEELPLRVPGVIASLIGVGCLVLIYRLVRPGK